MEARLKFFCSCLYLSNSILIAKRVARLMSGLVKCELRVASYELRVTSCELLLFCELRVAS